MWWFLAIYLSFIACCRCMRMSKTSKAHWMNCQRVKLTVKHGKNPLSQVCKHMTQQEDRESVWVKEKCWIQMELYHWSCGIVVSCWGCHCDDYGTLVSDNNFAKHIRRHGERHCKDDAENQAALSRTRRPSSLRVLATAYHLFTDRFYTSCQLAQELLNMKIHTTGTIKRNRQGLPDQTRWRRRWNYNYMCWKLSSVTTNWCLLHGTTNVQYSWWSLTMMLLVRLLSISPYQELFRSRKQQQ